MKFWKLLRNAVKPFFQKSCFKFYFQKNKNGQKKMSKMKNASDFFSRFSENLNKFSKICNFLFIITKKKSV